LIAAFDDLDKVVRSWTYRESVIKPTLHQRATGYRLQFVEESDDDTTWTTTKLNDIVEWAAEKLKSWPDVNRMSFDIWDFKHSKDAEKFITLFHLSWDQ